MLCSERMCSSKVTFLLSKACKIQLSASSQRLKVIGNDLSLQTADEAGILDDLLLVILLCPEISEGVDDDTKNQVKDYNDDHEEEEHVVDEPEGVERLIARGRSEHVPDASPVPEPLVEGGDDAHPEGVAGPLLHRLLLHHGGAHGLRVTVAGGEDGTGVNEEII